MVVVQDVTADNARRYGEREEACLVAAFQILRQSPEAGVTEAAWCGMMRALRPKLSPEAALVLYKAVDVNDDGDLTLPEFQQVAAYALVRLKLVKLRDSGHQDSRRVVGSEGGAGDGCWHRFRVRLRSLLTKHMWLNGRHLPVVEFLFDMLVLVNVAVLVAQLAIEDREQTDSTSLSGFDVVQYVLLSLFVLELAAKIVAFGFKKFYRVRAARSDTNAPCACRQVVHNLNAFRVSLVTKRHTPTRLHAGGVLRCAERRPIR